MYMNITSSGDYRCYSVAIIPGASMESSSIQSEYSSEIFNITENEPIGIDREDILPSYDKIEELPI